MQASELTGPRVGLVTGRCRGYRAERFGNPFLLVVEILERNVMEIEFLEMYVSLSQIQPPSVVRHSSGGCCHLLLGFEGDRGDKAVLFDLQDKTTWASCAIEKEYSVVESKLIVGPNPIL